MPGSTVNGELLRILPTPWASFSNWQRDYDFLLGNDSTGLSPWKGKLFLLALYDRVLERRRDQQNYLAGLPANTPWPRYQEARSQAGLLVFHTFSEGEGRRILDRSQNPYRLNLTIPRLIFLKYWDPYWMEHGGNYVDDILNIAGYLPLGVLLFFLLFPSKNSIPLIFTRILLASCCGLALSLAMEGLQYLSKSRFHSITDIATNSVGALVGAVLGLVLIKYRAWLDARIVCR